MPSPPPPDEPPSGASPHDQPGPAPRGRRGNGLSAGEWGALVDVDPRLSDALLARLAAAEVPAHVEPAGATTDPVSRAGTMPVRPLDRLWVDVARADAARAVVEQEAEEVVASLGAEGGIEHFLHAVPRGASGRVLKPPPRLGPPASATSPAGSPRPPAAGPPSSDDEAWRAIVEGFERSSDAPVPPWPVEEDVDPEAAPRRRRPTGPTEPPARRRTDRRDTDPDTDAGLPGWVEPERLADDGHYVPPPPPP
ncbi:MAG TPA: hypothetical protein VM433_15440, partial [Mycobacteriales bacterium]|nr:hypothetical protein [Mycobacteriales bacterium]